MKPKYIPQAEIPGDIMVVDDNLENLCTIEALLKEQSYKVRCIPDVRTALKVAVNTPPDLILLGTKMSVMDGYNICRRLKDIDVTRDVPVIFLSGLEKLSDKVKGFEAGGVDYITTPFQEAEVLARVNTHLKIRQLQRQLQEANETLEKRIEERTLELQKEINVHKCIEEELRESEASLRKLIENSDDIIVSRDREFRVTVFNEAFRQITQKLFGFEIKTGQNTLDYLPEGAVKHWKPVFDRVLKGEKYSEELASFISRFTL